jgi:diaminopimelate decarboxylase
MLVGPTGAVLSRVLETQDFREARAVVVDASLADLPDWASHPHPILWWSGDSGGKWRRLDDGCDLVLGRTCMERDRPDLGVRLPPEIEAGDLLLITNAGAYDASRAFTFGV